MSLKTWLLGPSESEVAQQGLDRLRELYGWFESQPQRLEAAFRLLDADNSIATALAARQGRIDAAAAGQGPRVGYDAGGVGLVDTLLKGEKTEQAEQLTRAGAYRALLLSFHVSPATCVKLEEIYRALVRDLVSELRAHPDLVRGRCGNLIGLIAQDLAEAGRSVAAIPLTRALTEAAEKMQAAHVARKSGAVAVPAAALAAPEGPPAAPPATMPAVPAPSVPAPSVPALPAPAPSAPVPPVPEPPASEPVPRTAAPLSRVELFRIVCREACQDGLLEDHEKHLLKLLQQFLRIEPAEAAQLYQEAKAAYVAGQLAPAGALDAERTFQQACRLAWADTTIQQAELELLRGLSRALRIDSARARQILEDERQAE